MARIVYFGMSGQFFAPATGSRCWRRGTMCVLLVLPALATRRQHPPPRIRGWLRRTSTGSGGARAATGGRRTLQRRTTLAVARRARHPPRLRRHGLRAPENASPAVAACEPDATCVACFPRRLPPRAVADCPRLGCLNVHPVATCRRNRGPDPLFLGRFRQGDDETGVTVHLMDEGLDRRADSCCAGASQWPRERPRPSSEFACGGLRRASSWWRARLAGADGGQPGTGARKNARAGDVATASPQPEDYTITPRHGGAPGISLRLWACSGRAQPLDIAVAGTSFRLLASARL